MRERNTNGLFSKGSSGMSDPTTSDLDEMLEVPRGDGTIKFIRFGNAVWADLEAHLEYLAAQLALAKLEMELLKWTDGIE